jgi:hypothetical protein
LDGDDVAPATMKADLHTRIGRVRVVCTVPPSFCIGGIHQRAGSSANRVSARLDAYAHIEAADPHVACSTSTERLPAYNTAMCCSRNRTCGPGSRRTARTPTAAQVVTGAPGEAVDEYGDGCGRSAESAGAHRSTS